MTKVVFMPLVLAHKSYGALLKEEEREGFFLYLPPGNTYGSYPLVAEGSGPLHLSVFVGEGSSLVISLPKSSLFSTVEATLEAGASLILELEKQGDFSLKADVKSAAQLTVNSRHFESHKEVLDICLSGSKAKAELKGIKALKASSLGSTDVRMHHKAESTESFQHYKMALKGRSSGSFSGLIYVDKEAFQTKAYQLTNTLLLSEEAESLTKPALEIFNEDVKASHGATVTALDSTLLFYLQARGIAKQEAEKLLIAGFLQTDSLEEFLEGE